MITRLDKVIHPIAPVASALLTVAECKRWLLRKRTFTPLIVCVEAECKVVLEVRPERHDVRWHIACTTGSIEAAAAVAKQQDVSVDQTTHALGIVVTQVSGLRNVWVPHQFRSCSSNGLIAAMLAQGGYTRIEKLWKLKEAEQTLWGYYEIKYWGKSSEIIRN